MGPLPLLALLFGILNTIAMFADAWFLYWPFLIAALILAIVALFRPGGLPSKARDGRTAAAFAILLALMPFLRPIVEGIRYRFEERRRARETAPLYQQFGTMMKTFSPELQAFQKETGRFPSVEAGVIRPFISADGTRVDAKSLPPLTIPTDPFTPASQVRVAGLGDRGALVISVGQDGIWNLPKPPVLMDSDPNDPMALLAATGVNWRHATYDPSNGALSAGDVVAWVPGAAGLSQEVAFAELDKAWSRVENLTPPVKKRRRRGDPEPPPDPAESALTAKQLATDGEELGSLAAAARTILHRPTHPNFWTPDMAVADYYKAIALYHRGHMRGASDAFNDFSINSPNDAEAHYHWAIALYYGGLNNEALRHFAAAFQIAPTAPFAPKAKEAFEALSASRALPIPRPTPPAPPSPAPPPPSQVETPQSFP